MRARSTLPEAAASTKAVRDCQEFLDHNELELACDMLEAYAQHHPVSQEFWLALRDAARKMELSSHVDRYELRAAAV